MPTDVQCASVPPKRRWLQFGLRTLLGLIAMAAVGMGLWVNSAERQRRAVAFVRSLGGDCYYDTGSISSVLAPSWFQELLGEDYVSSVAVVMLIGNPKISDAGLSQLHGLTGLQSLILDNTKISDVGLTHLHGLKSLKILGLDDTQVTDAGLLNLTGLTRLQMVSLDNTKVTNAGLLNLTKLPSLWWLHLSNTNISDAGLRNLKGLNGLRELDLSNTQISDAGLAHLKSLTRLEWVNLKGTSVTDAGIAELRIALPECRINGRRLNASGRPWWKRPAAGSRTAWILRRWMGG